MTVPAAARAAGVTAAQLEAARRCGLAAYPAELIAAFEAYNVPAGTWSKLLPAERDRRRDRLAAARADVLRGAA